MTKFHISINQVADFSTSTTAAKLRIIKEQLKPNKKKIAWYQLSKAKIKKSLADKGNHDPIQEGINILEARTPTTKWRINDRTVSIEALRRFLNIRFPAVLKRMDYTVLKPKTKSFELEDVDIIVAPDVVIRGKLRGITVIGGIKIHISKNKKFDFAQAQVVSSIICEYLKKSVAEGDDIVLPELCFCLEVFDERMVPAPDKYDEIITRVKNICDEVKILWKG